jgi:hypothetical protein
MATPSDTSGTPASPQVTDPRQRELDFMHGWLDVQRKQIDLQGEQLEIKKIEIAWAQKQASETLNLYAQDRRENRTENTKRMWIGVAVIALLLVFCGVALYAGKEAVVLEGMRIVGSFLGGGGIGYSLANRKKVKEREDSEVS